MIERGASIGPSKNNERLKELQTLEEEKKKKQLLLDDLKPRRNIFNEAKISRIEDCIIEIDKRIKQLYES